MQNHPFAIDIEKTTAAIKARMKANGWEDSRRCWGSPRLSGREETNGGFEFRYVPGRNMLVFCGWRYQYEPGSDPTTDTAMYQPVDEYAWR